MLPLNIASKWQSLGVPHEVLSLAPECAEFLVSSGLAYTMVGLANTTDAPGPHGIMVRNGQIYLKMEGEWKDWKSVKKRIELHKEWSYVSREGLVPTGRLNYRRIYPIHVLSENQYQAVWKQAIRFYENHHDVDPDENKTAILQLMTTHHEGLVSPFWLEHCTIRLIVPNNGSYEVYSLGAEMSEEQFQVTRPGGSVYSAHFLTTVETKIAMGDFEEFRSKDICRVTSVPLTATRAQKILEKVQRLSQEHIRFNYVQQNCLCLAHEIYQETGYEFPDLRMPLGELLWERCLNGRRLYSYPKLGPLGNKIVTVLSNALVMLMGGWKMSRPLPHGASEDKLSENRGLISFSKVIRSIRSLWEEETSCVYHSDPLIKWQLEQPSTFVVQPGKRPKMYVLP